MPLNLVQQRGELSIWDGGGATTPWDIERWVASMIASVLFFASVRRRWPAGGLMAAAAGALGWWAISTPETRRRRRGQLRAVLPLPSTRTDPVSEASEESFPASDAPAWTPMTGSAGRCPPSEDWTPAGERWH
jgi:hypothetical protein